MAPDLGSLAARRRRCLALAWAAIRRSLSSSSWALSQQQQQQPTARNLSVLVYSEPPIESAAESAHFLTLNSWTAL